MKAEVISLFGEAKVRSQEIIVQKEIFNCSELMLIICIIILKQSQKDWAKIVQQFPLGELNFLQFFLPMMHEANFLLKLYFSWNLIILWGYKKCISQKTYS